ncbi:MAG: hypothetical protein IK074_03275, partial [Bacteroidales bacterium]|nr:hypothetical protein [Bacteroidales bacterium]
EAGLPIKKYWKEGLWPALCPGLMTLLVVSYIPEVLPPQWWRILISIGLGVATMALSVWYYGLTEGERAYILSKVKRQ